jgi:hypothetical protein
MPRMRRKCEGVPHEAHEAAPNVCPAIWEALKSPIETYTAHAVFDGEEVYCFLPPFPVPPPLENQTMRPHPGDVMFFYAAPNAFVCTRDERLSGGAEAVHELAFMYGETDLRHFYEEGFRGSLVGHFESGLEPFVAACRETLRSGRTRLHISRANSLADGPEHAGRAAGMLSAPVASARTHRD